MYISAFGRERHERRRVRRTIGSTICMDYFPRVDAGDCFGKVGHRSLNRVADRSETLAGGSGEGRWRDDLTAGRICFGPPSPDHVRRMIEC